MPNSIVLLAVMIFTFAPISAFAQEEVLPDIFYQELVDVLSPDGISLNVGDCEIFVSRRSTSDPYMHGIVVAQGRETVESVVVWGTGSYKARRTMTGTRIEYSARIKDGTYINSKAYKYSMDLSYDEQGNILNLMVERDTHPNIPLWGESKIICQP